MFVLFVLGFCTTLAGMWPILLDRLNVANWLSLALVHMALLISLLNLYFKALRRELVQRIEVLLAAGLALMASGVDLSLLWKICGH
jgi:hypothetical protein